VTEALDDITLGEIRHALTRLTAQADSSERPKPNRINPPDHNWPGHEWHIAQQVYADHVRRPLWVIRTADDPETCDGVHIAQPDPHVYDWERDLEFIGMAAADARRLAMALLAAADRAEHLSAGVPRLEDRRIS
jgi:hypothetical protein